jgi:hypothetical protein
MGALGHPIKKRKEIRARYRIPYDASKVLDLVKQSSYCLLGWIRRTFPTRCNRWSGKGGCGGSWGGREVLQGEEGELNTSLITKDQIDHILKITFYRLIMLNSMFGNKDFSSFMFLLLKSLKRSVKLINLSSFREFKIKKS